MNINIYTYIYIYYIYINERIAYKRNHIEMKIKKTKINKKKKKEKQRKEEERTVMARYEGPVVEKSSRFKSRRRVNIYFLSMVEPNRSTSCNYMKENSGMKK